MHCKWVCGGPCACFLLRWWSALCGLCVCVGLGKRRGEGGNVLLFSLCVYLVKGKILVRWSSCDLDCPTEEGAGTVNSLFFLKKTSVTEHKLRNMTEGRVLINHAKEIQKIHLSASAKTNPLPASFLYRFLLSSTASVAAVTYPTTHHDGHTVSFVRELSRKFQFQPLKREKKGEQMQLRTKLHLIPRDHLLHANWKWWAKMQMANGKARHL